MLPYLKQGSRVVDLVAVAAFGGAVVGFAAFLTFSPLHAEMEWRRRTDVQWIALLETSREALTNAGPAMQMPQIRR